MAVSMNTKVNHSAADKHRAGLKVCPVLPGCFHSAADAQTLLWF